MIIHVCIEYGDNNAHLHGAVNLENFRCKNWSAFLYFQDLS